ncbi:MAG: signal peptidase I [Candidatus Woesearchaeota archaeon]
MDSEKQMGFWRKLWWFIWEDNSVWSWIANVVIAFVLIKFVIYPGLGLLLGTGYPIVAVVSSSMEHDGSFDEWWSRQYCCLDAGCSRRISPADIYSSYGISRDNFKGFPFKNGFNKGDIMILRGPKELAVGDILVYWTDTRNEPIIHRVVQVMGVAGDRTYKTKGDRNCGSADFEQGIGSDRMIGKAVIRVPFLGWIKIGFVELLKLSGLVS